MRNLLNKKLKNEKGLTLIELLAVIVILAIIALIAIPAIGNIISNSKSKAILSDATTIVAGAKTAIADGACDGKTTAENDSKTCNQKQLADYVEGLKNTGTYLVVKTATGYDVTYSEFNGLNKKYSKKVFDSETPGTTASQDKIAEAMGGK
ncbi:MAG: prepilin-type N-terminal cleavage/methylation domain-containing protein [Kurthia gibsonii]|uniref:Prepilin-type N-terminal cleavage/methylation domain-containing protein n=1 Tax=Kurthia gibsonii TaxID=33946 RepID=A0ABU9LJY9_9BACL|nr:prepilin-type N-terminal cleavage/methylation domain-containing protein [Kurthia gibsonii]